MAITTLNGVIAGFQPPQFFAKVATGSATLGRPVSWWTLGGFPGAGSVNTTLNGAVYSSSSALVTGQIPHYDPGSGNSYLGRFQASTNLVSELLLLDRLWDNGGITITSTGSQSITSPTWPARDANGATSGVGVLLAVEVSAATGAGTPTITIGYTNSSGTASHTATNLDATAASAIQGSFFRMALQAGDVGVQSVQSITLSATWTSGTINIVAYRVLAALECSVGSVSNSIDAVTGGFPQIFNGVVPFLVAVPSVASTYQVMGTYIEAQG